METLKLSIRGMRDEDCVRAVVNAIQDLPHIGHVEVSLATGQASIDHGRLIDPEDILRSIHDAGYKTEV